MTDLPGSHATNPLDPELHIPGLPSDDEIAAQILRSIPDDPLHMRTAGTVIAEQARESSSHKAFNLAHRRRPSYMPEPDKAQLEQKVREAKLLLGPGPDASPYENELFQQRIEEQQHLRGIAGLEKQLGEVVRMVPARGSEGQLIPGKFEPVYAYSADRRAAMQYELEDLQDRLMDLHGASGLRRREKALSASVEAKKRALRAEYVRVQGQKRAEEKALDAEIETLSNSALRRRGLNLEADAQR
jgi:hypothetical protein